MKPARAIAAEAMRSRKNLEKGHHTVTLRVSEKKDAESLGNKISVFALLVGEN